MVELKLTEHCVSRYQERVKPALGEQEARADLERLVRFGELKPSLPWHTTDDMPDCYLELTDGIALPLHRRGATYVAVSCLTRAGKSDGERRFYNDKRRQRQRHRAEAAEHKSGRTSRRKKRTGFREAARRDERWAA